MTYRVFDDLDAARRLLADEGGWIVRCQDGSGDVAWTDDEGIVIDLLGTEYVAKCEARQCWDETVLYRSGHLPSSDLERLWPISEKLARTHCAAVVGARLNGAIKTVPLARVAAALEDPAILAAAEGHVSALCEEEETAHWSDTDTWEAGSLPQPPGFDTRDLTDQAIIRAALAERIREVLGEV